MSQIDKDIEYAFFCQGLEKQYTEAKENGIFEVLKIINLDSKNSSPALVKAIDYFKEKDGNIDKNAPIEFLSKQERGAVNNNGDFRPHLYTMFLSQHFSEALESKKAFLENSLKYAFEG